MVHGASHLRHPICYIITETRKIIIICCLAFSTLDKKTSMHPGALCVTEELLDDVMADPKRNCSDSIRDAPFLNSDVTPFIQTGDTARNKQDHI